MQSLLLAAEFGCSVAQLVDCDQLLLMGIDQTVDALADPDQLVPQVGFAPLIGIGGSGRLQSAVEFGTDRCRVLEQAGHFGPDNLIEHVLAHRPTVTQRAIRQNTTRVTENEWQILSG